MTEQLDKVREKIEQQRQECLAAIAHIGAANYPEREREAEQWVDEAFAQVISLIEQARKDGYSEAVKNFRTSLEVKALTEEFREQAKQEVVREIKDAWSDLLCTPYWEGKLSRGDLLVFWRDFWKDYESRYLGNKGGGE